MSEGRRPPATWPEVSGFAALFPRNSDAGLGLHLFSLPTNTYKTPTTCQYILSRGSEVSSEQNQRIPAFMEQPVLTGPKTSTLRVLQRRLPGYLQPTITESAPGAWCILARPPPTRPMRTHTYYKEPSHKTGQDTRSLISRESCPVTSKSTQSNTQQELQTAAGLVEPGEG